MADFLSNLIQRSAVEVLPSATLQPRLPSLFEPLQGSDGVQEPVSDLFAGNIATSPDESSAPAIPQNRLGSQPSMTSLANRFSPMQETPSSSVPQPRRKKSAALFEEAEKTTIPDFADDASFGNFLTIHQRPPFNIADQRNENPPAKSLPADTQTDERLIIPEKTISNSIQTRITPAKEDSAIDSDRAPLAMPLSRKPDQATRLQPVLPASQETGRHPLEYGENQEPQQVIEIHIGRVEVRALAAPAPQPAKPRPTTVMTLDEYLQRRKAGDRG
jgi:hypothetical protein